MSPDWRRVPMLSLQRAQGQGRCRGLTVRPRGLRSALVKVVPDEEFEEAQESEIVADIPEKVGDVEVNVEPVERTESGKFRTPNISQLSSWLQEVQSFLGQIRKILFRVHSLESIWEDILGGFRGLESTFPVPVPTD